jgi:two-component system, OmpR family, copper resistance phosphate regulon response regulator CusR
MRILIVEDELKTASYLKKGFKEHGFVVDTADNGEDGLFYAQEVAYDCVILDIMLPKLSGWEVLEILRKKKPNLAVLCLTARDDVADRVKGLELGADDYLIKPFSFSELLARVRTITRRGSNTTTTENLTIADLEMDLLSRRVTRAGKRLNLTAKEFTLLKLLVQHAGEVISRTLIAEKVWDINFDSDTNIIDVAVRRLRNKCDSGFDKKLIHTIRGVGYVIEER